MLQFRDRIHHWHRRFRHQAQKLIRGIYLVRTIIGLVIQPDEPLSIIGYDVGDPSMHSGRVDMCIKLVRI